MIKALILGINGKMGANVREIIAADNEIEAACGVDMSAGEICGIPVYSSFDDVKEKVDVIIDFSSPAALEKELVWAQKNGAAVVIAATGYSQKQLELIDAYSSRLPVFKTANFSLGINLLVDLVKSAAETLGESFDIEIIEKHHRLKADAPSGTALMLAESANSAFGKDKEYVYGREGNTGKRGAEIGLHSVRGGTIVGEHEVIFAGEDEIITLSHSARSKKVFAAGAVKAAKWICGKPAGKYDMKDLLAKLV